MDAALWESPAWLPARWGTCWSHIQNTIWRRATGYDTLTVRAGPGA